MIYEVGDSVKCFDRGHDLKSGEVLSVAGDRVEVKFMTRPPIMYNGGVNPCSVHADTLTLLLETIEDMETAEDVDKDGDMIVDDDCDGFDDLLELEEDSDDFLDHINEVLKKAKESMKDDDMKKKSNLYDDVEKARGEVDKVYFNEKDK